MIEVGIYEACVGFASVALWRCRPIIRAIAIILVEKFSGEEIATESLPYLVANGREKPVGTKPRRGTKPGRTEAEYLYRLDCDSEDSNTL